MAKYSSKRLLKGIRINRYIVYATLLTILLAATHTIFLLYLKPTIEEYIEVVSDFKVVCLGWIPVATVIMVLFANQHIEFSALLSKNIFREYAKIVAGSGIILTLPHYYCHI